MKVVISSPFLLVFCHAHLPIPLSSCPDPRQYPFHFPNTVLPAPPGRYVLHIPPILLNVKVVLESFQYGMRFFLYSSCVFVYLQSRLVADMHTIPVPSSLIFCIDTFILESLFVLSTFSPLGCICSCSSSDGSGGVS